MGGEFCLQRPRADNFELIEICRCRLPESVAAASFAGFNLRTRCRPARPRVSWPGDLCLWGFHSHGENRHKAVESVHVLR